MKRAPLSDEARRRIAKLIRLLGSDKNAERTAAIDAITRTLNANQASWHDLAALVLSGTEEVDLTRLRHRKSQMRELARSYLQHPRFSELPTIWQELTRQVARDGAYAYEYWHESDLKRENDLWKRVRTRFEKWDLEVEREQRRREREAEGDA